MTKRPFTMICDDSGCLDEAMIWVGSTTTTGGEWSVDYTAAGFDNPPKVLPIPQLSAASVYDRAFASLSSAPTATSASGYGLRGENLALLGPTVRNVPDGTVIHVVAIGA